MEPLSRSDISDFEKDHEDGSPLEDTSKRRRIARACDVCRRKKIRCDGQYPCSNCAAYQTECVSSNVPKKRATPRGAKYIQNLELRCRHLETLLAEAIPGCNINEMLDATASASPGGQLQGRRSIDNLSGSQMLADAQRPESEDDEDLAERFGYLMSKDDGASEYLGASNTATILISSAKRIQGITGDDTFNQFCQTSQAQIEAAQAEANRRDLSSLVGETFAPPQLFYPDLQTCMMYIQAYFETVQVIYPLFDKEEFLRDCKPLLERQGANHDLEMCIIFLVVMALGSHVVHCDFPGDTKSMGWTLYAQAHRLLLRVMQKQSLRAVQGMILLSLYMQPSGRTDSLWLMVGSLVRSAQSLGIHRKLPDYTSQDGKNNRMTKVELEARKHAFWTIYILDNNLAVISGKPAAIHDCDCDQDLPDGTADELPTLGMLMCMDGKPFNFFNAQIQLAQISCDAQKRLYSAKAMNDLSKQQISAIINELHQRLLTWCHNLPPLLRPTTDGLAHHGLLEASRSPNIRTLLLVPLLHLRYHNTIMTIHRRNFEEYSKDASSGHNTPSIHSADSRTIALSAARASLRVVLSR